MSAGPEINVVLNAPEIPPNTGSVARTCAAGSLGLHLVEPLGFELDDRHLKRAGLDYWPLLRSFKVHRDWEQFEACRAPGAVLLTTASARVFYSELDYPAGTVYLVFGSETRGLPASILNRYPQHLRIPMLAGARSLNLASAVSLVAYEVLRQRGFPGLV